MEIDSKYLVHTNPLDLKVLKVLDFHDMPVLTLEQDNTGTKYISYCFWVDGDTERRSVVAISEIRLASVLGGEMDLSSVYSKAETGIVYIQDYSLNDGTGLSTSIIPSSEILGLGIIPAEYAISSVDVLKPPVLDKKEILGFAEKRNKLALDLYIQAENLRYNIKPYAFYKVFTPIIEILKSFLGIDARNADRYLAFSNFRQSSLGITVELNYSQDLFLEKESRELRKLIDLLNCKTKEDLERIIQANNKEKYLTEYVKVVKSLDTNKACLWSAYANPISKEVLEAEITAVKAKEILAILDETLSVVEDIEEIKGTFLEIDVDASNPKFKVSATEEDLILKGKIDLSLLEKLKADLVNIGKNKYEFVIKTIYKPESTVKSEEIKRFLIDYRKLA